MDLQTFLWDQSCKVQEGGVLQRMYCYKMDLRLNQGCNLWDVQVALSICLCLANSTHLGFLACSHIENSGVLLFFVFFFISPAGWKTGFEMLSGVLSTQQCKEPLQDPWVSQAQLGWDGKRGKETARELVKRIVMFCTSFVTLVGSAAVWAVVGRLESFLQSVWSFQRDSIYLMTFCLGFLMCVLWLSLGCGQWKHPFYNALFCL